jgi:hypothetical protein
MDIVMENDLQLLCFYILQATFSVSLGAAQNTPKHPPRFLFRIFHHASPDPPSDFRCDSTAQCWMKMITDICWTESTDGAWQY